MGKLPWSGIPAKTKKEKYEKIKKVKEESKIEDLTEGYPEEFPKYFNYCRSLKFEDKPSISDLKRMFKNVMKKKSYENDGEFDWVIKSKKLGIPITYGEEEGEDEDTDYKEKLRKLLGK